MRLLTTTIGAYPKPDYLTLPDWFNDPAGPDTQTPTEGWAQAMARLGDQAETLISQATREAVTDQVNAGVDIPTDGEIVRENYIHYHCRHLNGISFDALTERTLRNGAYSAWLPTIVGPVAVAQRFLSHDWRRAQQFTDKPVKITMPGPMTIGDTTADHYYNDPKKRGADIADALNVEVRALADAGCRHIQIDEPLFARRPQEALAYGLDHLERAFHACPNDVVRTVHMCCGYPDRLDNPGYPKADRQAYFDLADAVDYSSIMAVSIEDAHRNNDLKLLERYRKTTVILGVLAIARSRVESVDEIRQRLRLALEHIDEKRLIAAPDCGLALLGRELALEKLNNMSRAARSL